MNRPQPLLRILGLSFGIAVTVGNTIGGGILRTPGDIARWLPNPWLFVGVWAVGAFYALLGANALSELGTMLPRSGGQYVFARHAYGHYAGFVVGWIDWVSSSASTAAIAIVIGESLASVLGLRHTMATPIAMAFIVVFTALLLRGTKLGDLAQRVTSLAKAAALVALIVACFVFAGRAVVAAPASAAVVSVVPSTFAAFMLAAQSVIYAYDGWSGPIYFSEELDDPARQIPQSMFLGLLSVAAIYLLINIAFVTALPTTALAGSPLAAATVADALFGARGELIVRLIVIVSLPSAVNACLLMASRVIYSVSRDGLGVAVASSVRRGTPVVALALSGLVALGFLATGTFETIIAIAAFFFVGGYTLSFLAVFTLRRREPERIRPYRAIGHPWTTGFVLIGSLAFLTSAVIGDRRNSLFALAIIVASYPIYRVSRRPTGANPSTGAYL